MALTSGLRVIETPKKDSRRLILTGRKTGRIAVKSPAKHRKRCREHLEIPLTVCPELDNQILNLKLLPASLNSSKRDKVTERAKAFAKELHDAKLLSDTSWERIQLAEWKRLILSE